MASLHKARLVAEHLRANDRVPSAVPIIAQLDGLDYPGARYAVQLPNARGEVALDERLYLLGDLPSIWDRDEVVLTYGGEEWYIAVHANVETAHRLPEYHPHGAWFGVHRWPSERIGPIDLHDQHKRQRVEMSLS